MDEAAQGLLSLDLDEREVAFHRLLEAAGAYDHGRPSTPEDFRANVRHYREIWRIAASIGVTLPAPRPN